MPAIGEDQISQPGENSVDGRGKPRGQPEDNVGKIRGRRGDNVGITPARDASAVRLVSPQAGQAGDRLRITRGQPGDSVGTTVGDGSPVPRRGRLLHRPCTPAVDKNMDAELLKQPLSTLSTVPMTTTALALSKKEHPPPVRAWGHRSPPDLFHPTVSSKHSGGGSL